MECVYHIVSAGSVLLLNGAFVQTATSVRYERDEPLYLTVLPLEGMYLPYTAELLGGKPVTNVALVHGYDMGEGHSYIECASRSAYVYSPAASPLLAPSLSLPAQLLRHIRAADYEAARAMLTPALSRSVTDEGLGGFFEGVTAVRENIFTPSRGWLLLRGDGTAETVEVKTEGGLISDIVSHSK